MIFQKKKQLLRRNVKILKHHEKFSRGQQYNFTSNPHRKKNDVDNDLINYEDFANTLVHNPTIAPIEKCGDLGDTFSGKSTSENSESKVDGIGQSQEDNCDHFSSNSLEDLPPLTSDDEKYLNYAPSDDEGEASTIGEVEIDRKLATLGQKSVSKPPKLMNIDSNSANVTQETTPDRKKKKKKKRTRNRGLKQKQP
ncbi:predicted protein [Chaetoceros tenuissimus]|uniref:Uncharacterized protein n=1 Tax=Chaetoceros tenuissimus TaxID=426638 RepID=A0AAD3CUT4_9STRA|nr:predicted protein [Chaetoceros tenuissimus]